MLHPPVTTVQTERERLVARWATTEGAQLRDEVLQRLMNNAPLDNLPLGRHQGRIDLRGLPRPQIVRTELFQVGSIVASNDAHPIKFTDARWEGFDLSESSLESVLFYGAHISDCRFDRADLRDSGLWASEVVDSSFANADLRDIAVGGIYRDRWNVFERVAFVRADMRGLAAGNETYIDCDFAHAQLHGTEFSGSRFVRCGFAGTLREVIFQDRPRPSGGTPLRPEPNTMENCDFSAAKLRWVEFRRIDLRGVQLPQDDDDIIVRNYRCVLLNALSQLNEGTQAAAVVAAILESRLRNSAPDQWVGHFNRLDLTEGMSQDESAFVLGVIGRAMAACSN